jgi:UDP-N-acetylglucosamine 2-epimerase (non-hydrolysing)
LKILTVLGTRPEFIRLSVVLGKLDRACRHVVVHTGQNYDPTLNEVFFRELGLRTPDHHLGARGSFGEQVARILAGSEQVLRAEEPDRFLVLGDTNSSLAAIMAKRMGIPVYHMEAGNRCYDDRVPEEVNRRLIDHCSDVLMPYTERSRHNLLREGIPGETVYVTGNPIYEVIRHYEPQIAQSTARSDLDLEEGRYFVVTLHRAENVDVEGRLRALHDALGRLSAEFDVPVVVSTHPHTRARLDALGLGAPDGRVRLLPPFGFFDFISLERKAMAVLTDSGTVQEECAIFGVPTVTLRDVTERPETLECGSNILSGAEPETILRCVRTVLAARARWAPPREYLVENVSDTVLKIVTGFLYR